MSRVTPSSKVNTSDVPPNDVPAANRDAEAVEIYARRERRNVQRRILLRHTTYESKKKNTDEYMTFKNDDEFLKFIQQYDAVLGALKNTLIINRGIHLPVGIASPV